jgi:hypothetical protein
LRLQATGAVSAAMEAFMKGSTIKLEVSEERIATRAFELWMARGCPITDGSEDWFTARAELEAEMARAIKPKKATALKRKAPAKKLVQIEA